MKSGRDSFGGIEKMTKLPPRPWTYEATFKTGHHPGSGFVYLVDANGRKIANLWGSPDEKIAIAELICDASEKAKTET